MFFRPEKSGSWVKRCRLEWAHVLIPYANRPYPGRQSHRWNPRLQSIHPRPSFLLECRHRNDRNPDFSKETYEAESRGILWNILAGSRWVRERSFGCGVSSGWNRTARRVAGIWPDGTDNGLCDWTHLGMSPESCRIDRTVCRRPLSCKQASAIHHLAGPR